MKKPMLSTLAAAALALSACGGSERALPASEPPLTTTRTTDAAPVGQSFELRLRGENAQGYDAVLLPIRSLEVTTAQGESLPVRLAARTVDLTRPDHAHLVGHFFVPEGVGEVKVALTFDDAGGWEQRGVGGTLDTRVPPLRFVAPVDALTQRGRAVVRLDVDKSLQPLTREQRVLLPHLQVNY